ncbi:hypothetical protein OTU49_006791 [Cherax quadricarinatus]|uniref:Uncharacterized protein n=1 Tax=Cherax quadricarinatus TaxID=27406 RepID=A0AAW0WNN0_CHEQU
MKTCSRERMWKTLPVMHIQSTFAHHECYTQIPKVEVKSQLPRRESERRNHTLFRHCDILTAIETRLSLLNMTFIKYVDCHMCCFIPGKVIDEIYRVLRFVQSNKTLPRAHEILTELRDISSMAMEHFEEKIIRTLKPTSLTPTSPRFSLSTSYSALSPVTPPATARPIGSSFNKSLTPLSSSAAEELTHLVASNKYYRSCVNILKKEVSDQKSKLNELRRKVSEQERVALEQNRILSEQTLKLTSQEGKLNEVQPNLLPVNLPPAQLPSPTYLTSSSLAGYTAGEMALGMSPAHEVSPTTPVYSSCGASSSSSLTASQCNQGNFSQLTLLQEATAHEETIDSSASSSQTICGATAPVGKSNGKKHKKRKLSEEEESQEGPQMKWKKN